MEPKSVKVLKGIIQLLISFGIHTILALITKYASSASVLCLKAFPPMLCRGLEARGCFTCGQPGHFKGAPLCPGPGESDH